ncbi:MAG TPA: ATP-binding protein [Gaiellales bacterium]|nr:ATP-binding protein [Gaiellales bacterium]
MSLRTRLTLAGGGAVFVALAIASSVIYVEVRSKLHDQIDFSLIQSAENVAVKWHSNSALAFDKGPNGFFQVVPSLGAVPNAGLTATGAPLRTTDATTTAPSSTTAGKPTEEHILGEDKAVAAGVARPYFRNVRVAGAEMRLYTMRLPSTNAGLVRTLRPLTEANATIARVRWLLLALTLGGALAAGLLGRLAANAVLRPVRALAGAVREVSATRDLNQRIAVSGRDELASLAANFNTMLAALDESQQAQQQLIADTSHELRTPLTAHRANIELLARPDLPVERRRRVLDAAVRGIEELSALVGDLIEAARDGRSLDARVPLALDELLAKAVKRAQHRAPGLHVESRLEPHRIVGARSRLERAVDNVLDNAIKWSPPGGTIDVRLVDGILTVRDHGPGIDESDLPHIFDRFYRAAAARALPGSGLGLAIVKQTVDDHGGSVTVANADGGGALLALRFDADAR